MNSNIVKYLDRTFGLEAKFIFCMYQDKAGLLKQVLNYISAENALIGEGFSKTELVENLSDWIEEFKSKTLDVSLDSLTQTQQEVLNLMREKFQSQIEILSYSEEKLMSKLMRYIRDFELTPEQGREVCAYIIENRRKPHHAT